MSRGKTGFSSGKKGGSDGPVLGLVDDGGDSGVLDHPGAHDAGLRLFEGLAVLEAVEIEGGAQHLVAAGGDDGVALGVDGHALLVLLPVGDAVGLPPAHAHVAAVLVAPGGAVVARGHDLVVLHDDGPVLPSQARGPPRHLRRDVQIVLPLADPFHSRPPKVFCLLYHASELRSNGSFIRQKTNSIDIIHHLQISRAYWASFACLLSISSFPQENCDAIS